MTTQLQLINIIIIIIITQRLYEADNSYKGEFFPFHALKTYGGGGIGTAPFILNLGPRWTSSLIGRFTSGKELRSALNMKMAPRAGLAFMKKRSVVFLYWDWNLVPSSP